MKNYRKIFKTLLVVIALPLYGMTAAVAREDDNAVIRTEKLSDTFYVLFGRGGNIGVSAGKDGVFVIDDKFAPLTDKIVQAIKEISNQPIRFIINTHYHGDHTGGNENFGKKGAVIVAHDTVRNRLLTKAPSKPEALPSITFNREMTFHINGETTKLVHVKNAHTDGDVMVYFVAGNILHMGDTYFNRRYPYIDVDAGGDIDGMIMNATHTLLSIINDNTVIIPGHGKISNRSELEAYRDMLVSVRDTILTMKEKGKSCMEIVKANPTADFDETWSSGNAGRDRFVQMACKSAG